MFGIYGQLSDIHVEQDSCVAYITFQDVINAFIAKMQLDKMPLVRDKASLQVNFKEIQTAAPKKEEETKTQIKHTFGQESFVQPTQPTNSYGQYSGLQFQQQPQMIPQYLPQTQLHAGFPNPSFNQGIFPGQMGTSAPCFNPKPFLPQASFVPHQEFKSENAEEGIKYTCRYDIQIDNEKEF